MTARVSAATLDDLLDDVAADRFRWWPGCWGQHVGWTDCFNKSLDDTTTRALDHASSAGLITTGPVLTPYFRRRPVTLTPDGEARLADTDRDASDIAS
jgi:hypothetical protein